MSKQKGIILHKDRLDDSFHTPCLSWGRKGQQIMFTTMMALFIFFLILTIFSEQLFVNSLQSKDSFDIIQKEAVRAADNLMMSGYPEKWDATNVQWVGFVDEGVLNMTKVLLFNTTINNGGCPNNNTDSQSYQESKALIGVQHDYLIILEAINNHPEPGWNKALFCANFDPTKPFNPTTETELLSLEPEVLAYQERLVLAKNATGGVKPVSMKIYVYTR